MSSKPNALFIQHVDTFNYHFYADHPFDQARLHMTQDLLARIGALQPEQMMSPASARLEALQLIHRSDYVNAVRQLSEPLPDPDWILKAASYGLDTDDTPYFPGMHQAASAIVGGSVAACDAVMSGRTQHAIHLGGGLHHAFPGKGAGFCVYNDASVAIALLREQYDARVLYIDTDVHHGDGVQWSYYTDPNVMTYSIHETGKFLFPGTGFVYERGSGEGFGSCVNVPLEPYTEDESWLECFQDTIEQVTHSFKPDIIISQHGCDAHALDPLSHMHCSMRIYKEMPRIIHKLAHTYCEGRWVALGGGGYEIWRVVPRAWSLLWLEMTDHPLIQQLTEAPLKSIPTDWIEHWQHRSPVDLPHTWLDNVNLWEPMPRRRIIQEHNAKVKNIALEYVR
ncbi:acetoin utilization protein AcuC [Paenibacillus sp. ACRRX]|uniref:acetoin utilization protein AcuC n=1 Tax=unclassified Paenibacillus TaxID=185978 RepID=UPI001EF63122|nr:MULTISPECIES: acetoin utilization protein AcuC [unclassified Paenibacillus]MCG7407636.1 acetoin utilization protein AcuC [Paenibacillus sp. ACRRX]MDK8180871.1 acetoin utilization protein AcuC [Paenibacillus sp. UMB4589-SE434]